MNLGFVTRAIGAGKLALKTHAPTIMVVGGVAAMGTAAVLVGKQTLKLEATIEPHTDKLEKSIEAGQKGFIKPELIEINNKDIYKAAGFDIIKLYAVPGVLFVSGACLVFGGHRILLKRNATLALAFTSLQKAYQAYRRNVRTAMGEEFDQCMLDGYRTREKLDAKGKPTGEGEAYLDDLEAKVDPYNRVFEQGATTEWVNDLGINKMTVHTQQRYAQELLNRRGYLYLCEVYKALGFDETPLSRVVGWKVRQNPDGSKDFPVVDFGLDKPLESDWIYANENAIYLDFNCQGLIVGGEVQKILERA